MIKQQLKIIGGIALTLIVLTIIGMFLLSGHIKSSTKKQIFNGVDEVPTVYTAIVLGASVRANGNLSQMLEDRVESALALYKNGKVKRFLLSGDNGTKSYNEPQAMKEYLLKQGVPEDHIYLDYAGFDTYDSLYRARLIFNVQDAIIVTQQFHLPRALYIANTLDLNYYGYVGDLQLYQRENTNKRRELLANVKAYLELLINKDPTFKGAQIPIDGAPQTF